MEETPKTLGFETHQECRQSGTSPSQHVLLPQGDGPERQSPAQKGALLTTKWTRLIALAGEHKASLVTFRVIWSLKEENILRAMLEKFAVCWLDEEKCPGVVVAMLVRRV